MYNDEHEGNDIIKDKMRVYLYSRSVSYSDHTVHDVHYFNFHNLQGAFLTIGIGLVIYVVVVRFCLMKKDENNTRFAFLFLSRSLDVTVSPLT